VIYLILDFYLRIIFGGGGGGVLHGVQGEFTDNVLETAVGPIFTGHDYTMQKLQNQRTVICLSREYVCFLTGGWVFTTFTSCVLHCSSGTYLPTLLSLGV
jgi:hypothetical protein